MRASFLALAALAMTAAGAQAQTIFNGSGANPSDIVAVRDAFRAALGGGTVAGAAGSFGGVRREINWDAVPDIRSAPNLLPGNFFNVNSPRGAIFSTPGTGVAVSDSTPGNGVAKNFGNIDPSYTANFKVFSPEKLFTPIGSNIVDVSFFVAGTNTPGFVRGFASVFSDVGIDSTTIQFFGPGNQSLGTFGVQSAANGMSFLGVDFGNNIVSRVRITNGNAALGAGVIDDDNLTDLVVMDDFIYSEPAASAAPEPGSLALIAAAGIGAWRLLRRRRL